MRRGCAWRARRLSHAATCTPSLLRTCRIRATRHGATTSSSAATNRPSVGPVSDLAVPDGVHVVLETLWSNGYAAYVVGGAARDTLLARPVSDWDVATSARPEQIKEGFPPGRYENKFGTVTVPSGGFDVQTTTFRRDHQYGDHRRPDSVTFTDSLDEDLARRDFTANAIAWGREADADTAGFVDPTHGAADLEAR